MVWKRERPAIVAASARWRCVSRRRVAGDRGQRLSDYIRTVAGGDAAIRTVDTDTALRERMARCGAERDQPKLADWETYRTGVLDSGLAHPGPAVVDYLVTN